MTRPPRASRRCSVYSGYACQPSVGSKVMSSFARNWIGGSPSFCPAVSGSPDTIRASASTWAQIIVNASTPSAASHWPCLM